MPNRIDITGQRFGRLVAVRIVSTTSQGLRWECLCDCGRRHEAGGKGLRYGSVQSCGCLRDEASIRRGQARRQHGMTKTVEFATWQGMLRRCTNPNHNSYPEYGARGIKVCARWATSFATFYADMGPRPSPEHSIDRYPNQDGDYEPGNCRWATDHEQAQNRRSSVLATLDGETKCLKAWCRELGLDYRYTWQLMKTKGLTAEQALTRPRKVYNRKAKPQLGAHQ